MCLTFLFSFFMVYGQNNSLKINAGNARGRADQRIDFLKKLYIFQVYQDAEYSLRKNTPDDEYFIGIGYNKQLIKRLSLGVDLNYSCLIQDLRLPVNKLGYFNSLGDVFAWRDISKYHLIQVIPSIRVHIISNKFRLGADFSSLGNVSFLKHIEPYNLKASRIEYFSTELYPGIFMGYNRFNLNIGVRAWHWKYRDDAIANNGLKVDPYNPFKMRLSLSYDIYKW